MPRKTVESVMCDFDIEQHDGRPVFLGVDLSHHKDMTCVAYVVPTGHREVKRPDGTVYLAPTFDAWVDSFTPADTLKQRAETDKAPYLQWVDEGYLQAVPGERVRYDYVAYSVAQADKRFDIQAVAYDQYAYSEFMEECGAIGLDLVHRNHPQGGKRRSAPDEALVEQAKADGKPEPGGLWMPGSIREVEALVFDGRIRLRSNPLLMTALMATTFSDPDPLGNKYIVKDKAARRIDAAVALCMAVGAAIDGAAEPTTKQYQMLVF
jgi:phage terminase large subunit-like protein